MISMTDTAITKVKELMALQDREDSGLRIYVAGGGCSGLRYGMALDENPADDDDILQFDGLKVFIDPMSAPYLEGAQVDYVETMMGAGFKVDNPNAVSTCGCGSSFQTEESPAPSGESCH
ncbi:MAG: iron-sulfur cluster insertion protein ErpA [Armatimonadetes bacterium]|nr:iron-sulfur cluster insertion protein ErpA [Armatimonadota bacterium]